MAKPNVVELTAPFSMNDIKENPELLADFKAAGPPWKRLTAFLNNLGSPHGVALKIVFPYHDPEEPYQYTATYPNRGSLFKFMLDLEKETSGGAVSVSEDEINDFLDELGA